jgi:hypothetical protein
LLCAEFFAPVCLFAIRFLPLLIDHLCGKRVGLFMANG